MTKNGRETKINDSEVQEWGDEAEVKCFTINFLNCILDFNLLVTFQNIQDKTRQENNKNAHN